MNIKKWVIHKPVMLQEVLESLPDDCKIVMDGTLGHGGHSREIMNVSSKTWDIKVLVWVDRDVYMMEKAKERLADHDEQMVYVQGSYAELQKIRKQMSERIEVQTPILFDFMLLDIWVNMDHFKVADRGFSIKLDGELDMRYDRNVGTSARDRLAQTKYDEMCRIFGLYTDFTPKYISKFVEDLVHYRKRISLETTHELAIRAKKMGINDKKLAVIFQAIRIQVNNELWELELFLKTFTDYIQVGGRCAIMTYHSIEDRIVKNAFKDLVETGKYTLYNKKVIKPNRQEVKRNKAARSAKYRVIQRIQ